MTPTKSYDLLPPKGPGDRKRNVFGAAFRRQGRRVISAWGIAPGFGQRLARRPTACLMFGSAHEYDSRLQRYVSPRFSPLPPVAARVAARFQVFPPLRANWRNSRMLLRSAVSFSAPGPIRVHPRNPWSIPGPDPDFCDTSSRFVTLRKWKCYNLAGKTAEFPWKSHFVACSM
jgi:hypothetical protein